jgi:hypothetical protein
VAWAYDYHTNGTIGATFQTLPGASFVNGAAQSHNRALTTASAEVKWINGWSAAAKFEGEFSDVPILRRQGHRPLSMVGTSVVAHGVVPLKYRKSISFLGGVKRLAGDQIAAGEVGNR